MPMHFPENVINEPVALFFFRPYEKNLTVLHLLLDAC